MHQSVTVLFKVVQTIITGRGEKKKKKGWCPVLSGKASLEKFNRTMFIPKQLFKSKHTKWLIISPKGFFFTDKRTMFEEIISK